MRGSGWPVEGRRGGGSAGSRGQWKGWMGADQEPIAPSYPGLSWNTAKPG